MLFEAIDDPLPLTYNQDRTVKMRIKLPSVNSVSVYESCLSGEDLDFVEYRDRALWCWEVAFGARDGTPLDVSGMLRDESTTKVVATALSLLQQRLFAGNRICFYPAEPALRRLYDGMFALMNITSFQGHLARWDIPYKTPDGAEVTAIMLQHDSRTLRVPSMTWDGGHYRMIDASRAALVDDESTV